MYLTYVVGYGECISSRPPLHMELLTTPSPCTYTIPCNNNRNTATRVYRNNYFNKIDNIKVRLLDYYNDYNNYIHSVDTNSMHIYYSLYNWSTIT